MAVFLTFRVMVFNLMGYIGKQASIIFKRKSLSVLHLREEIRNCRTPKDAANEGRKRTRPLRPDWELVKDDVMRKAVLRKFETHQEICEVLLNTGDEEIVENAPGDYYWGCGKDGSGKNMLGKILMEVRELLRGRLVDSQK